VQIELNRIVNLEICCILALFVVAPVIVGGGANTVFGYSQTPISLSCGAKLSGPSGTIFTLNSDLGSKSSPCPGAGLVITSNGLTLNCDGHTIWGKGNPFTGSPNGIIIQNVNQILIYNCIVNGFYFGFMIDSNSSILTLDTARANNGGGYYIHGSHDVLFNNNAQNNLYGFFVVGPRNLLAHDDASKSTFEDFTVLGSSNTLTNDRSAQSQENAFVIQGNRNTISYDVASKSSGNGFFVSGLRNVLSQDSSTDNHFDGYSIFGTKNLFFQDRASNDEYGFVVFGSGQILYKDIAIGNVYDGFFANNAGNSFLDDKSLNNNQYGFYDNTHGIGTEGTGNTYSKDVCLGNSVGSSHPNGLCEV
jgi:hypothetical protein